MQEREVIPHSPQAKIKVLDTSRFQGLLRYGGIDPKFHRKVLLFHNLDRDRKFPLIFEV